ncbi:MAG: pantoate--beta-alanine ligase [Deltaproteobacteria bacterium]|nr:MAG: pantoate--beta-alanine ligase [Deltaproteobacteria bacterium]
MRLVTTVGELQMWADAQRAAGRRIALVPTMGALHAGHRALCDEARRRADVVVVSIFVNPTQFDQSADLEQYPRPLESDLETCRGAGVDAVFTPGVGELYPEGSQTWVEVTEVSRPLEGRSRPGHFRGVATVVSKLFLAAKPHVAVFGEKDYQQLAVIRRMVRDLGFDVEIAGHPIVREADGLALSSRNVHLDAEMRRQALVLSRALDAAERAVSGGEREVRRILHAVALELGKAPLLELDYAELRDPETFDVVSGEIPGPTLLALAARLRKPDGPPRATVRLIDNRVLQPPTRSEE